MTIRTRQGNHSSGTSGPRSFPVPSLDTVIALVAHLVEHPAPTVDGVLDKVLDQVGGRRRGACGLAIPLLVSLLAASSLFVRPLAAGSVPATVELTDGTVLKGVTTASPESVKNGLSKSVPWDTVFVIRYPHPLVKSPYFAGLSFPRAGVMFADGGRLTAKVLKTEGKHVIAETALLGTTRLPSHALRAIAFRPSRTSLAGPRPSRDTLMLENGDRIEGALRWIDDDTVGLRSALGLIQAKRDRIVRLELAARNERKAAAEATKPLVVEVTFKNCDRLRAALVRLDSGLLSLRSDALGEVQVSDSLLRSIRPLNAAVTKLTDLQPKETVPGQFLALKLPYQLSTAIGGGPLTIRDNAFDFGFGVHAGSLLTFELGGQFGMLDVTVGIDDSANTPGDAEFVVLADGQEVARSGRVDRQAEPKRWRVPIKGAKTLGLKVLPGATGGVNCRANWAEPVLIKSR